MDLRRHPVLEASVVDVVLEISRLGRREGTRARFRVQSMDRIVRIGQVAEQERGRRAGPDASRVEAGRSARRVIATERFRKDGEECVGLTIGSREP